MSVDGIRFSHTKKSVSLNVFGEGTLSVSSLLRLVLSSSSLFPRAFSAIFGMYAFSEAYILSEVYVFSKVYVFWFPPEYTISFRFGFSGYRLVGPLQASILCIEEERPNHGQEFRNGHRATR